MNILIIVGSLRKDSMNKSLARALMNAGVEGLTFEMADIASIPLYNQDDEARFPASVQALKDNMKAANGIIVVTPEYNRSIPGVLKNVIDWTSRPYGESAWKGKPVAIAGASEGAVGTAAGQGHLRDILGVLDTRFMGQPEMYMGMFNKKLDAAGTLSDQGTADYLKTFIQKFKAHIENLKS